MLGRDRYAQLVLDWSGLCKMLRTLYSWTPKQHKSQFIFTSARSNYRLAGFSVAPEAAGETPRNSFTNWWRQQVMMARCKRGYPAPVSCASCSRPYQARGPATTTGRKQPLGLPRLCRSAGVFYMNLWSTVGAVSPSFSLYKSMTHYIHLGNSI